MMAGRARATVLIFGLVLALPALSWALQPPRAGEREKYQVDGSWEARLNRAQQLGNDRTDPRLVAKVQRKLGKAAGKTDAEIAGMMPTPGNVPPEAWQGGLPSVGSPKVFVLLVDFSDEPHDVNNTQADVQDKFFSDGNAALYPYNSLHDYYDRASYSLLDIQGTVFDWYRAQHPRSYYENLGFGPGEEALMMEAIDHWDGVGHDFSQYDNDSDGVVDAFFLKWTGDDNGWANFWWAYQWEWHSYPDYEVDGVSFGSYVWSWIANPSYDGETVYNAHVDIHESGHLLGLPDLYDYAPFMGPEGGVGGLDMMDSNWGDHNCFSKYMLDWLDPTEVLSGAQTIALHPTGTHPESVLIMPSVAPGTLFGEFFMAQYRNRGAGNDADYPIDGYTIWHVDSTLNTGGTDFKFDNSYTVHKYLKLMQADGLDEIEEEFAWADASDFYIAGRSLEPDTNPNSRRYSGTQTGVYIKDLGAAGATLSADFGVMSAVQAVPGVLVLTEENCVPSNGAIDPGETVTVTIELRNTGWGPSTDLEATLLETGGVTDASAAQSYGVLQPDGAGVARSFTFTTTGECGDALTITLQVADDGVNLGTVSYSYVLGFRITEQNFDSTTLSTLPSGWSSLPGDGSPPPWTTVATASDTSPNAVFAPAPEAATENKLVSPTIAISSSAAKLTFRHRYALENGLDAGVLEIAIGSSGWQDILTAGGEFVSGGYNGSITTTQNPLGKRAAWTGTSDGFVNTFIILPQTARNANIRLRWRLGTNHMISSDGWWVDTFKIEDTGVCCDPLGIAVESDWINVPEAGTRTLQFKLGAAPAGDTVVTVARTAGDANLAIQGAASRTFTAANWNTYQTITYAAAADDDAVNSQATFVCSAAGLHDRTLTVNEADDDELLFATSAATLNAPEGGTVSFNVHLTAQPPTDLAVTVSRGWGDSDVTVQSGAALTFTTANWATDQTVVVAAAVDADAFVGVAAIRCSANGMPNAEVEIKELDSDVVNITTDLAVLNILEGQTATLRVKLAAAPAVPVSMQVGLSTGDTGASVLSGAQLVFNTSNWSAWQTAIVRADEDGDSDNVQLTLLLNGTGVFDKQVTVNVTDNDTTAMTVPVASVIVPESMMSSFPIRLGAKPAADVNVHVGITGDADISVLFGEDLVFTPANWDDFQTVTLAAEDDDDMAVGQATVRCTGAGMTDVTLVAFEGENDAPGMLISSTALAVAEKGTAAFTIRMAVDPGATATVLVERVSGDADLSIQSGASLQFTSANWKVPQTVVVEAAADLDITDGQAVFRCSSTGLADKQVTATEDDDAVVYPTWYADTDSDGAGDPDAGLRAFVQPAGYVEDDSDCDDSLAGVHPGATEVCGNSVDDDCDTRVDEGCEAPAPTDGDGDGVPDADDDCPGTTAGTTVDAQGCPIVPVDDDADDDGVVDASDDCPNTPVGTDVDDNGCAVTPGNDDADGDGVLDANDDCADTPADTNVDAQGCPIVPVDDDADDDGVIDANDNCPDTPTDTAVDANGCPTDDGNNPSPDDGTTAPLSLCGLGLAQAFVGLCVGMGFLQMRRRSFIGS